MKKKSKKLAGYELLSAAERITGVPRSTIRSAIDRGELTAYPLGTGKTVCCKISEVKAWNRKR